MSVIPPQRPIPQFELLSSMSNCVEMRLAVGPASGPRAGHRIDPRPDFAAIGAVARSLSDPCPLHPKLSARSRNDHTEFHRPDKYPGRYRRQTVGVRNRPVRCSACRRNLRRTTCGQCALPPRGVFRVWTAGREGARFCGGCGHRLAPAEASHAPPAPPPAEAKRPTRRGISPTSPTSRSARARAAHRHGPVRRLRGLHRSPEVDPEDVHQIMEGCFERIAAEIHRLEGTISQYRGDGVMALRRAGRARGRPRRAVHAALGIQQARRARRRGRAALRHTARMRIGPTPASSSGESATTCMDYTAEGDTTNGFPARVAMPARVGADFESTHRAIEGFEARDLGS